MSHTVNIAQNLKPRGKVAFLPIASGLDVSAWASRRGCSSINIVGDCTRCGGGRVAER
jgi:hypothetical protein